ncbi:MAG: thioredoxin domain-containing protein, partial [Lachnospiraceae bacterium]|nr:thioredoxin domain-containing protein [Lachnospiraceae bacterium]
IFDQIGYGFSRYSTDRCFLAPHFEKMLYDNALLIMAYVSAYCVNGENIYLGTAEKTAEYILREMTSREGGFYSAQDADSEGVEGRFYTFTLEEMLCVLGEQTGRNFAQAFDITGEGNFEGTNIPNLLKSNALTTDFTEERKRLYEYRKKRTRLHLDQKILLSWNSLMIAAFAMLYRVTHDEIYLDAAEKSQHFIRKNMCNGLQLYTSYHAGKHSEKAFLDDYAFYIGALIELYHATLDSHYLAKAQSFCMEAYRRFYDRESGGFYLCERDRTELFMNPKETYDGAMPSGNSVMAYNFVRLYQLTDDESYREHAERQIKFMTAKAREFPVGHSFFLLAVRMYENSPEHITIVAKEGEELSELLDRLPFLANISVVSEGGEYRLLNGRTTYYVCRNGSCLPPENDYIYVGGSGIF